MAQARLCPACRKTRLSRYNPESLCAPCVRAARTTPALAERGAPTWLWDSPPMRDALARVDLAAAVAVFRAAAGLSQHELADITGWSQSSLSLFESGHRDTLYDVRALLRFRRKPEANAHYHQDNDNCDNQHNDTTRAQKHTRTTKPPRTAVNYHRTGQRERRVPCPVNHARG